MCYPVRLLHAGFCSVAGRLLFIKNEPSPIKAVAAIDGNICRCTGYKSIEKAAAKVNDLLQERRGGEPVLYATISKIVPSYFNGIKQRLLALLATEHNGANGLAGGKSYKIAGGTDMYVQKPEELVHSDLHLLATRSYQTIVADHDKCLIPGSATVTDLLESACFNSYFPQLASHLKLVSSTPIRNMATIAGNFVNASPIGDLTIFFLALDARLILNNGGTTREVSLRKFYKGYKNLNKASDEIVESIWFHPPSPGSFFNFEKVSKRTHLDIASVNTAILLRVEDGTIIHAAISAGGVGPVPAYLPKTSAFFTGNVLSEDVISEGVSMAQSEISPISDARGTAAYKSLLLGQLIKAHFIKLFPALWAEKLLQAV